MNIRLLVLTFCALLVAVSLSFEQAPTALAQDKTSPAAGVQKNFTQVSGWVEKAAEAVPADKYSYKPVDTVRTFGEQVAHIADSYNYYCAHGSGNKVQWSDPIEKGKTDKATVTAKLKEAMDKCNTVYNSESANLVPLIENMGHTNLHYGNIITYMRMMGLKPPSS